MSQTFKKLGIEYRPFTKDQVSEALMSIQSMRLEQILVGESEQFDWNNILQKPELVDCKNPDSINADLMENQQDSKFSAQKTLFLFKIDDPFRRNVTNFLTNKIFSYFLLFIIVLNIVAFCIHRNRFSIGIEILCNIIFGLEILLRTVSQGVIMEPHTYLRNKWNWINFLSFLSGWLILIDTENIVWRIFCTIRLLRVIRLPQEVPALRIQLDAYIGSFKKLGIVIVPLIFFLIYFSVIGLHFLKGLTTMRCRINSEPVHGEWEASEEVPHLCGLHHCPEGLTCGSPYDYGIEWNKHENDNEEFMWNFVRFDNLFNSLLVVFTYFCLIGWSETTYMFWKAMNTYVAAGYFLLMLVFLAFIFSNLLLATFYESFMVKSSIKNSQQKAKKQQQQIEFEIHQKKQQLMMDRLAMMSKKRKSTRQEPVQQSNFTLYFEENDQTNLKNPITISNLSNELSESVYFLVLNNIIIVLCTLSIVIDYDSMPTNMSKLLQYIEFACTLYFFFELTIFLFGKGAKRYLQKSINQVDFIVIVSQLILFGALYLSSQSVIYNENRTVQVLKSIKLIRILKFAYSAKLFYHISILTRAAIQTIRKLKTIIFLWVIFAVFIALIGNSLLENELTEHETPIHYNDFGNSLMGAFNIFYNEEWHLTMFRYARVTAISFIFHIISIILCQVIFIKLLSAIFLNEFTKQVKVAEQIVKPIEYKQAAIDIISTIKQLTSQNQIKYSNQLSRGVTNFPGNKSLISSNVRQGILRNLRLDKRLTKIIVDKKQQIEMENLDFLKQEDIKQPSNPSNNLGSKPIFNDNENDELLHQPNNIKQRSRELSIQIESQQIPSSQQIPRLTEMKTLFVFDNENSLRKLVQKIIHSIPYKIISFIAVGLTAYRIMYFNPLLDPNSQLYKDLDVIFMLTTGLYCSFIFLHVVGHGLFGSKNSYLTQSYYNVLNCAITILEIVVVTTGLRNHIFSLISSLRVLEFIKLGAELNHSIKCAQGALMNALVRMVQLSIFCFILFLVYGTFAMKLLKGFNYYCSGLDTEEFHILTSEDCMDNGGAWEKHRLGFDNILESSLTLFITATTEGWSPIMEQIWSIRGNNEIPEENYNRWWAAYFQIFFFAGNTCMLNMFIGLVVSTYDESKLKAEGTFELEGNQREWFDIKKSIHKLQPKVKSKRPTNPIRKIAFFLVKNTAIKKIQLTIIFINTLALSLYYSGQDKIFHEILDIINTICIFLFIFEILARFIAKDFKIYCKELINIIEIFGIWVCLAERIIDMNYDVNFYFLRCFKAFSVSIQMMRNFRIIKRFNRIERLFHSIFSVIPNALSMLYIMFVFLFIYTILGVDIFCFLRPQSSIDDYDVHFRKFSTAMFSLVRVASSELWWQLLVDAVHVRSADFACIEIDNYEDFLIYGYNGCGTTIGYLYFITFHLIFSLVLLNLFIASILGAYEEHAKQEQNAISKYQLNDVLSYWVEYDPYGTGFLNYKQFWKLSSQIAICFGVSGKDLLDPANKKNFLRALNIPLYEDKDGLIGYLFHDVILTLTKISVELKYGVKDLEKKNSKELEFHHDYYNAFTKTPYNSGQMSTIIYLQKKVRTLRNKSKGIKFLDIEALKLELQQQAENQ